MTRNAITIAVVLAALTSVPTVASAETKTYAEALEEAEGLVLERDYKSAIKAFKKAQKVAGEPTYECCFGLADSYIKIGAHKNAVTSAREALKLARSTGEQLFAYNLLGIGLFANGSAGKPQLEEAVGAFEKILEITESLPPENRGGTNLVRYSLGVSLLKLERDEEGVAALKEFLATEPSGTEARVAQSYVANPLRARVPLIPDFEVVTLDGEYLTSEDLLGKVVLIDFWGTWCPPCVASIPHLQKLSRRSAKSPFVLLSVSNDGDGEMLRRFVEEHEMTWPQVWDEDRKLVRELFQVSRYPTFIVVDHEGEIVYRQSGWGTGIERDLDAQIAKALRAAKKAGKS